MALKVIRPEHGANEAVVERLLREARIAASLRSKHVNRILDVGRTAQGMPYLVLEYLAAVTCAAIYSAASGYPSARPSTTCSRPARRWRKRTPSASCIAT